MPRLPQLSCAPPGSWPSRSCRRHSRRRSRRTSAPAPATPASVPWNSTRQHRRLGQVELGIAVDAATGRRRSSSMRATGMPDWMVAIVVSQPRATLGNEQLPAEIASGMPEQAQRHLGDDAERAFGADEQTGEVVAGRGFLGPRAGAQERSVGGRRRSATAQVLHRAVAHRVGARGAGRGHAADRGIGAGIDREEQPLSRRCSLSCLRVTPGSTTQSRSSGWTASTRFIARQIDRHAAVRRIDLTFERGADAERHQRRVVFCAKVYGVDHVPPHSAKTTASGG